MKLTTEENIQYSRHLRVDEIGLEGQLKLKSAKVLMIGAGGLGCPILQYLAAAGVGQIGILDHDTVDQSNLQRQILYGHSDIGKSKAFSAAKRLTQINPFITVIPIDKKLTSQNALDHFRNFDIIVDGTDNFTTRYLINDAAVLTHKPVVFGSIHKFEGQVSVFNYQNGPTYRCLYPAPQTHPPQNCSEIGVLGILPGLIGSFQANEVLKLILGLGQPLRGKLLIYNALTSHQRILRFEKNLEIQISDLPKEELFHCETTHIKELSFADFHTSKSNYHLLDVRTLADRQTHSMGGTHIPLADLKHRVKEIPTNLPLVVYCNRGITSKEAILILEQESGMPPLFNLKGGLPNP